ncbi:MAG: Glucosamine-6-phosphate deaminase [Gemmatimonadaceae bacterium]|nr:Glucosamine-6-phosphate deaminase [Gemmatimonadaceae bacterium]
MMGSMTVTVGAEERLAADFTRLVTKLAREAIVERRSFSMAIPGGSVLDRLVSRLVSASIDWSRVDLFWCDERAVPPSDAASNYGSARRLLLDRLASQGALPREHRMRGEVEDAPFAARLAATDLVATLGDPPSLDLMVMGVGEDGHVCSLFPGHRALLELVDRVIVEPASPKAPPVRLTMTLPVIAAARHVILAAFGSSKAAAMRVAIEDIQSALPVAMARRLAQRCTIYLDHDAAAMLSHRRSKS